MKNRILLVDDERSILITLSEILVQHGFAVETACNARTAKQVLSNKIFDVVVSDLRMETPLSGYEVVDMAARQVPRPRIIVISGYPDPARDWRERGADAFLQKPALVTELLDTMDRLLQRRACEGAA